MLLWVTGRLPTITPSPHFQPSPSNPEPFPRRLLRGQFPVVAEDDGGEIAGFAKRQKAGPLCPTAAGQRSQPCGEIVGDRDDAAVEVDGGPVEPGDFCTPDPCERADGNEGGGGGARRG